MAGRRRDEFSPHTKRTLGERVGYRCSRPECRRQTIGPHTDAHKSAAVGVAAHIRGAAKGGPRYDALQSPDERASILNGIWLCQTCSRLIDVDPERFSINVLLSWKAHVEAQTLAELDGLIAPASAPEVLQALAEELFSQAFDLLARERNSRRLTWPQLTPQALEEVRRTLARAAALHPASDRLPLMKAALHVASGFPESALGLLAQVPDETIGAQDLRVRCLHDLGRVAEARSLLEEQVQKGVATPATYFNLGLELQSVDPTAAMESFRRALQEDPTYAEAHRKLYELQAEAGQLADALGHLEAAFNLKPTDPATAAFMAERYIERGRLTQADASLADALLEHPDDADLWAFKGEIRGRQKNYDDAERCLKRALALDHTNLLALNNQLVLLLETRDESGLRDFVANFPLDEASVPDNVRTFIEHARAVSLEHSEHREAEPSAIATEERAFQKLLERARGIDTSLDVPRFAYADIALPSEADGFTSHAVVLVVAVTHRADELPLAAVRVRGGDEPAILCCIWQRVRDVPSEYTELRTRLGSHLYEGLFVCPLTAGALEIDFACRSTEMQLMTVPSDPHGRKPGSEEAIRGLARREFPYVFVDEFNIENQSVEVDR